MQRAGTNVDVKALDAAQMNVERMPGIVAAGVNDARMLNSANERGSIYFMLGKDWRRTHCRSCHGGRSSAAFMFLRNHILPVLV